MRGARYTPWILLTMALGCGSGKTVPESGAVLLKVKCPAGAPVPDELRAWIYDDGGRLWDGIRIPEQGRLAVASPQNLGTILVAPGAIKGKLRIHLRGFANGARILDGVLIVESLVSSDRTFDILLDAALPFDEDNDGVPDSIDDCPGQANPAQRGCPTAAPPDADVADRIGFEPPPDAPPTSPEAGAEVARDTNPVSPDAGAESSRDATPASPDGESGKDAERDGESDSPGSGSEVGEVAPDQRELGPIGGVLDVGADGDVARDATPDTAPDGTAYTLPDVAADTPDPGDASGCGDECGKPQGALCAANQECASGACADGVCCTNACIGPCRSCNQPSAAGTCQGYAAGSDPEGECQAGSTCNGVGACGPPPSNLPNGQLCTSPSQCLSGFCADGVCCSSDCTTPCMACGTGTCVTVKRTEDVPECSGTSTCNAKGKCVTK